MHKWVDLAEKLGLVILSFGIVIFVLLYSKFWAADQQLWFLRAGDYQTVVAISIGVLALSWVLKKLLVWEVHSALRPKMRRRQ